MLMEWLEWVKFTLINAVMHMFNSDLFSNWTKINQYQLNLIIIKSYLIFETFSFIERRYTCTSWTKDIHNFVCVVVKEKLVHD